MMDFITRTVEKYAVSRKADIQTLALFREKCYLLPTYQSLAKLNPVSPRPERLKRASHSEAVKTEGASTNIYTHPSANICTKNQKSPLSPLKRPLARRLKKKT
jgi:hypothetical protein